MKTLQLVAFVTTLSMNFSFSQPIINVWGSDDSLATVAQIEQCLYHLGINDPILLDILFTDKVPKNFKGFTLEYAVPNTDIQYCKVRINARLNTLTKQLVLAHEMIHVKQYIKQGLEVVDQQQAVWKGQIYSIKGLHYRQIPWERDAFRQDWRLAKLIKNSTSIPQAVAKNQE